MVRIADLEEILPLRSLVLRENKGVEFAGFLEDSMKGVFHIGYFVDQLVTCIASFMPVQDKEIGQGGWQLRGMATHPDFKGMGLGTEVLAYANTLLLEKGVSYIWCNARASAVPFYEKNMYKVISKEFIIENIGPHFKMIHLLKS